LQVGIKERLPGKDGLKELAVTFQILHSRSSGLILPKWSGLTSSLKAGQHIPIFSTVRQAL
jgi:hypothetical protein